MVEYLLANVGNASSGMFFIAFFLCLAADKVSGRDIELERAIVRGFSLASAPTGLAFVICAFQPVWIQKLEGASLNFALAGAVILFISIKHGLSK
ncbi:hypothetical protein [Metapseudomonas sp. CR1201]